MSLSFLSLIRKRLQQKTSWGNWPDGLCFGLLFFFLTAWSWRMWPDVFVDYGHNLYIPWQLSLGKMLDFDIVWKYGPLSVYFHSLMFRWFGVSITTLIGVNLALTAATAWFLFLLFRDTCNVWSARLSTLVFLGVFCFSQYLTGVGTYNYICPYSYEMTHSVILSVFHIWCWKISFQTQNHRYFGLAGVSLGGVFLLKSEPFLASGVCAILFGLVLWAGTERKPALSRLATYAVGFLAPVLFSVGFFAGFLPLSQAIHVTAGSWPYIFRSNLSEILLYRYISGFDAPVANFWHMVKVSLALLGGIGIIAGLAIALHQANRNRPWIKYAYGTAVFVALWAMPDWWNWPQIGRVLPVTTIFFTTFWGVDCLRGWSDRERRCRSIIMVGWGVFSFLMLGKIILHARIDFYGFVHAMPAMLLLTSGFMTILPQVLSQRWGPGGGDLFRAGLVGAVLAGVVFYWQWSDRLYALKTFTIGEGGDTLLTFDPRLDFAPYGFALALEYAQSLPPNTTLLVLPEGLSLNYLARRPNPTPYTSLLKLDFDIYGGEPQVLQRIQAHPPDYITLMHRDTTEWGTGFFGADPHYGKLIMDWVWQNYEQVHLIGAQPMTSNQYGIAFLRLRSRGVNPPPESVRH
ncbi:MAG: glycosyltransferase family 39 protein [Blastocatellia bacterium]|nr:glycosyltransferase family 39 protein [Blastocatellia bacterium]